MHQSCKSKYFNIYFKFGKLSGVLYPPQSKLFCCSSSTTGNGRKEGLSVCASPWNHNSQRGQKMWQFCWFFCKDSGLCKQHCFSEFLWYKNLLWGNGNTKYDGRVVENRNGKSWNRQNSSKWSSLSSSRVLIVQPLKMSSKSDLHTTEWCTIRT